MTNEEAAAAAILKRVILLNATKFVPDGIVIESPAWLEYRKSLEEITSQEGYPQNITWPTINSYYDTAIDWPDV